VAIAYHLQKQPYVFPIVGGRKVENLQKNIEALEITLSKEQIEFLENVLPFDVGFPNWLIVRVSSLTDILDILLSQFLPP
jgi:diketogulonate reductase-like aldo/keto reductase